MIEKIKDTLVNGLFNAAYDLERTEVTAIGNSEEREDFAYAEKSIDIYSFLLNKFFPEINLEEIKNKGKLQFQQDYKEDPDNA